MRWSLVAVWVATLGVVILARADRPAPRAMLGPPVPPEEVVTPTVPTAPMPVSGPEIQVMPQPQLPPPMGKPEPRSAPLVIASTTPTMVANVPMVWVRADYMLWWIRRDISTPLVTTGPPASDGILGRGGVSVLCDTASLSRGALSGARLDTGVWIDREMTVGIGIGGFLLETRSQSFQAESSAGGNPVLARPTIISGTGTDTSELIAWPDAFAGMVHVTSRSQLAGLDVNLFASVYRASSRQLNAFIGFRHLQLIEGLEIAQATSILDQGITGFGPNILLKPDGLSFYDNFQTANRFYGGQIGLRATVDFGALSLDVLGKLALGVNHQTLIVQGTTTHLTPQGATASMPGGLLALPTNMGTFSSDPFAVVAELGVQGKYRFTRHLAATVGYNLLGWSQVLRPAGQIDRRIDRTQLPSSLGYDANATPTAPIPQFNWSSFWAQGLTIGMEFQF